MPKRLTLQAIQRQIDSLLVRAEKLKSRNKKPAIAEITRLMQAHDISLEELGGKRSGLGLYKKASPLKGRKAKAMYRNPKTGETWSGRGRAARWIAAAEKAGQKRESFLIKKR